jgi:glycosyltransferase involved in cell wall biosynthesis
VLSIEQRRPGVQSSEGTRRPHVVIVSFGYPPLSHVCGTRASEMGAALAAVGFRVTALTVDWRSPDSGRPAVAIERGVHVVRVDPRQWNPGFQPSGPPLTTEVPFRTAALRRFATLRRTVTWGPFEQWARHALQELRAIHAERPVDVVGAIHGDDSCHEVAARFHRETSTPWVADFKDPWHTFHDRWLWPVQRLVTSRRLRTCAALTETSRTQGEFDATFGRPWHAVLSGYDDQAMEDVAALRTTDRFTLAYFGNVGKLHDVASTARALRLWIDEAPDSSGAEFHVFANEATMWRESLVRENIAHILRIHSVVPRREAFSRMKGADVLLLLPMNASVEARVLIGVKELEYLASGTPVLCIGKLLPELQGAFGGAKQLVQAERSEQAVRFLKGEQATFREGRPSTRRAPVNETAVKAFAWPHQARILGEILEAVVRSSNKDGRAVAAVAERSRDKGNSAPTITS